MCGGKGVMRVRSWLISGCLIAVTGDVARAGDPSFADSVSAPFSLSIIPKSEPNEPSENAVDVSQLASMDLESLMNVQITAGTLTRTERHLVPAAVTVIDREDIDHSGA